MRSELAEHLEKKVLQLVAANPSLTQSEIAVMVKRSTKTIQRILQKNKTVIAETDELLSLQNSLRVLQSMEDAALNYVELATSDKNGAVRLGAQQRIDELRGIVTEKDRMRAKSHDNAQPGPMFVLPPGAAVSVTVNQTFQRTADSASVPSSCQVLDVKAEESEPAS